MLKIDFTNLHKVERHHGISDSELKGHDWLLPKIIDGVESRGQGFYKVIDDDGTIKAIQDFATKVQGQYSDIVICGIGGSALGPICLRDAFTDFFNPPSPQLHVLENIDPDFLAEAVEAFELESTLFLVVSKSGGTPETLAQYMFFRTLIEGVGLDIKDHMVFITDPKTSLLREIGNADGITMFDIPPNVGGRFSVQTPVGLLPAALIGIDIVDLIIGMRDMRDSFLNKNFDQNLPLQLATVQMACVDHGKNQNIIMPYHTKLRQFAAWSIQLIAESTGKFKEDGSSVGITPVPSLGVTDQHSQVQLFAEGPNDKLVIFINVEKFNHSLEIPVIVDGPKTDFMKGKTFAELLHAEQKATAGALTENDRPNLTITIPEVTPYYLGQLFMLFEGATAFLGELMEIDAFNQPGVERGKVLTRELL